MKPKNENIHVACIGLERAERAERAEEVEDLNAFIDRIEDFNNRLESNNKTTINFPITEKQAERRTRFSRNLFANNIISEHTLNQIVEGISRRSLSDEMFEEYSALIEYMLECFRQERPLP